MTKQEYLEKLQEKLEMFGQELQEEILEDYRQHFAEGENEGKSDEEIIEELGNIEDMIQDLSEVTPQENAGGKDKKGDNRTNFGFGMEIDKDSKRVDTERDYDYSGNFREIVLNGEIADMKVIPSGDDRIHIHYRKMGNVVNQMAYEYYQYEENGIFYAGVKKKVDEHKIKFMSFGRTVFSYGDMSGFCKEPKLKFDIEVPAGIPVVEVKTLSGNVHVSGLRLEMLQANTVSGDLTISEVEADDMRMNTASGDIKINGGKAGQWKMNTASGDITVKNTTLGSGNLNTASGDVHVQNGWIERIKCTAASGDIVVESEPKVCECSTASGDITVKSKGTQEKVGLSTASGDIKLLLEGSEGVEVGVQTFSGDVNIAWNGERQRVKKGTYTFGNGSCKVKLASVSGDITVNGRQ